MIHSTRNVVRPPAHDPGRVHSASVILSASRRTDIPAFYVPWLRRRLEAGFCLVPNPFRPSQIARVSLAPADVDAFVFWTRHARPLLDLLPLLDARGDRYYVHYTITGYGPPVEAHNPPLETALATFRELAGRLAPGAVVWRYDPILVGAAFPAADHLERFERIAAALEGHAGRVVLSILDPYRKTKRRLAKVFRWGEDLVENGLTWPGLDDLVGGLAGIAAAHGMTAESCAETRDFSSLGVNPGKCVDDRLLTDLFGASWSASKDRGQRPACGCIPSRDIGVPNTCTFGCAYCYATTSEEAARRRHREHDPSAPVLWAASDAEGTC